MKMLTHFFVALMLVVLLSPLNLASAAEAVSLSKGQMLYVPAYSHIYGQPRNGNIGDSDA